MWETLDLCIKVVDTESLDPLVPRLAQLVRSGIGLNTRYVVTPIHALYFRKNWKWDLFVFNNSVLPLLFLNFYRLRYS